MTLCGVVCFVFFFKQKTAYEMRISDWSSDVCSSDLAECCHPIPGDRIVGLRREGAGIEVHTIDCERLADGVDADWVDLAWGDETDGGAARLCVVIKNEPGSLAVITGILGTHGANIVSLDQVSRDGSFHTFHLDIEVHDVQHLMRILAALRATDVVSTAERL